MRYRGFTLLELLIAVGVIVILALLTLNLIHALGTASKNAQTRAILGGARTAIAVSGMQSARTLSHVEHPLANSRADASLSRLGFVRGEAVPGRFARGDAVATAGEALWISEPERAAVVHASAIGRLLLPSDRFRADAADGTCVAPHLYGMERRRLSVLGAAHGWQWRRRLPLPSAQTDRDADGVLDDPPYVAAGAGAVEYPAVEHAPGDLSEPTGAEAAQRKATDAALASNRTELASLSGLVTGDDTQPLLAGGRLRADGAAVSTWDGAKRAPTVREAGEWRPYRLRGPALVDAWGREVLCWSAGSGVLILESAGPDRTFRWHPGDDGVFQTAAHDDVAAGDDRDGRADNVFSPVP